MIERSRGNTLRLLTEDPSTYLDSICLTGIVALVTNVVVDAVWCQVGREGRGTPSLHVISHAASIGNIRCLGGQFHLGALTGSIAASQTSGAQIVDCTAQGYSATAQYGGSPPRDGRLVGIDPTNLRYPSLKELKGLSVFEPSPQALRRDASRWDLLPKLVARRTRMPIGSQTSDCNTPRERAHWYRELAALTDEQAMSGTARASIHWSYARLQHRSIQNPLFKRAGKRYEFQGPLFERMGRWAHRLLGYGFRPSRSIYTWIVVSVLVTAWSAWTVPLEAGAWNPESALRFMEVLLSPLRLLRLGGESAEGLVTPSELRPLAHLAVGIPFIFLVLALRNFFRSPIHRNRADP